MRFDVRIDNKVWGRLAKRLAGQGLTGAPADLLEALLATAVTNDTKPVRPASLASLTSTSIMVIPGKIRVVQVDEAT